MGVLNLTQKRKFAHESDSYRLQLSSFPADISDDVLMSADKDKWIVDIQNAVRKERARLLKVNGRISVDLKMLLKPALLYLEDVEVLVASEAQLRAPHSVDELYALERRLQFVEDILRRAIEHRKAVQDVINKHGSRARIVGG
jgi:hypothetical protein